MVIKAGQILPIQECIRAILSGTAANSGNPVAASEADMQKLSAAIASVLLHNQELYASSHDAPEPPSSSSHARDASQNRISQSEPEATLQQNAPDSAAERDLPHTTESRDSTLQGITQTSGSPQPESLVHHSSSSAFAYVAKDGRIAADSARGDVEAEVGCNDFVSFFVAELLGGSAER